MRAYMYTHTHICMHEHTNVQAQLYTADTQTHIDTQTHMHTQNNTHIHACIEMQTRS